MKTIKTISAAEFAKALKGEQTRINAFAKAKETLLAHYKDTLNTWGLLNENGLPLQDSELLCKAFKGWPTVSNKDKTKTKPMGINKAVDAKFAPACFMKRAYMSIQQEIRNQKAAEAKAAGTDDQKAGKKGKQAEKPAVISEKTVLAFLAKHPAVAYRFTLEHIAKLGQDDQKLTAQAVEAYEALETIAAVVK